MCYQIASTKSDAGLIWRTYTWLERHRAYEVREASFRMAEDFIN
jgi:hypothetical protein